MDVPISEELNISVDKNFECPNCGKTFTYRKRFINHMEDCAHLGEDAEVKKILKAVKKPVVVSNAVDKEDVWHECSLCDKTFRQKLELNRHMTSHSQDKPFQCIECGRRFSKKNYLIRHIPTHSEDKFYTCSVCKYQASRTDRFKTHMQTHGIFNPFKCSLCGQGFPGLKELNKHLNSHNSSALDPGANTSSYQDVGLCVFNCVDCGLKFDKAEKYKQHMLKHGVDEPYECSLCGESFASKLHLNRHLSNHNSVLQAGSDVPQDGDEFGESTGDFLALPDSEVLEKTFSNHNGDKPETNTDAFQPDSENHSSVVKNTLVGNVYDNGMSTGTGTGTSTSTGRSKNFDNSNSLVEKVTPSEPEHQGDNLFSCNLCGLHFQKRYDHMQHVKMFHKTLYTCTECGKSYTRRSNLKRHSCPAKRNPSSYKCTTCEISFVTAQELDDHIITHVSGVGESDGFHKNMEMGNGSENLGSLENYYVNHDPTMGMQLAKKKKKVKHKPPPHMSEWNDHLTTVPKKKVKVEGESSSHDLHDIGSQMPKKKVKLKQKFMSQVYGINDFDTQLPREMNNDTYVASSQVPPGNDYSAHVYEMNEFDAQVTKKKAKVKHRPLQMAEGTDGTREQPKQKNRRKTSSQILDMIEYELSKFQSNLSIPTVNRREHEESAIEYEKLVVYEFMNMKVVLPELEEHSVHDPMYDTVKVNDQISLKFFM